MQYKFNLYGIQYYISREKNANICRKKIICTCRKGTSDALKHRYIGESEIPTLLNYPLHSFIILILF